MHGAFTAPTYIVSRITCVVKFLLIGVLGLEQPMNLASWRSETQNLVESDSDRGPDGATRAAPA